MSSRFFGLCDRVDSGVIYQDRDELRGGRLVWVEREGQGTSRSVSVMLTFRVY